MAAPDPSSQPRMLDLETEIAKLKASQGEDGSTSTAGLTPSTSTPPAPIAQSPQGRPQSSSTFGPSSLLVMPGTTNSWLTSNPIPTLKEAAYKKWPKDLQLPEPNTLNRNLNKASCNITWHGRCNHFPRHCGHGHGSNENESQHLARDPHHGDDGGVDVLFLAI